MGQVRKGGLTFRHVLCIRLSIPAPRIESLRSAKLPNLRCSSSLSSCPNVRPDPGFCSDQNAKSPVRRLGFLLTFCGVADGARTHDNRNHNPAVKSRFRFINQILANLTFQRQSQKPPQSMRVSRDPLESFGALGRARSGHSVALARRSVRRS